MERLLGWDWPGNVRELFNVLEDAFVKCRTPRIGVETLAPFAGLRRADRPDAGLATVASVERGLITRTLESTGGNKVRAARQLGIARSTLYARMARYGLARQESAIPQS
jgi:transcriptional regulator of acetoin/glycerol metabolism